MTDNNDPLKFLKDLENGVAETTDAAAKAVQNGVSTLIDGVGNAVDSAVALFNKGNDTNSDDQESQAEERPAKYRDNREVTFKRLGSKRIRVHEVYYDEEGRQCESPQQFISLSRTGVELLGGNALRPKVLKSFNIKNADLYKEGELKLAILSLAHSLEALWAPKVKPVLSKERRLDLSLQLQHMTFGICA